jgi:DnaJ-class molecular chaperone
LKTHSKIESEREHDYYYILGISESSMEKEIKAAYKRCAFAKYLDRNRGDLSATAAFQLVLEISNQIKRFQFLANCVQIGEAFEILGDEQKSNV